MDVYMCDHNVTKGDRIVMNNGTHISTDHTEKLVWASSYSSSHEK